MEEFNAPSIVQISEKENWRVYIYIYVHIYIHIYIYIYMPIDWYNSTILKFLKNDWNKSSFVYPQYLNDNFNIVYIYEPSEKVYQSFNYLTCMTMKPAIWTIRMFNKLNPSLHLSTVDIILEIHNVKFMYISYTLQNCNAYFFLITEF
jgi:hypothetical protein